MCERCVAIDRKIVHYSGYVYRFQIRLRFSGSRDLIANVKAQKAEFHPRKEDGGSQGP